jgi:hypothetical protein
MPSGSCSSVWSQSAACWRKVGNHSAGYCRPARAARPAQGVLQVVDAAVDLQVAGDLDQLHLDRHLFAGERVGLAAAVQGLEDAAQRALDGHRQAQRTCHVTRHLAMDLRRRTVKPDRCAGMPTASIACRPLTSSPIRSAISGAFAVQPDQRSSET